MVAPSINFSQIRSHRTSQNTAFEELTRQLVLADPPADAAGIEHRGPGADGGVEILVRFADGATWGWQSKFFIDEFDTSQISQLQKSFRSALASYPTLRKYFVAIPRNLSGSGSGRNSDARRRWDSFVEWTKGETAAANRTVEISLWDETELIRLLSKAVDPYPGVLTYWFDLTAFSPQWLRDRFEIARADLGDRYSPDDHVDVHVQVQIDTVLRNSKYQERTEQYQAQVANALDELESINPKSYSPEVQQALAKTIPEVARRHSEVMARDWVACPRIDLNSFVEKGQEIYRGARALLRWKGTDTLERVLRSGDAALEGIIVGPYGVDRELLRNPFLLLAGVAGTGKSHILAHAVDFHLREGGTAILLLGQYFSAGDPWPQLVTKLGLAHKSQDEILGAFQAAALATGRPSLIAFDAINESEDAAIWRHHLAGLVAAIKRFDRVALIVSCRSTYEDYCLPRPHGMVRREHRGFEGNAAEAARQYLDKRGIDRPATPFLTPEFTNPLFVATSCRALEARGETAFPKGLDGISDLFRFYVDAVQDNLRRKGYDRIDPAKPVVWNALEGFAHQLALESADSLPNDKAKAVLENYLYPPPATAHQNTFLFRLEDEGLLRRVPNRTGAGEEVSFTFQRFSDHFVAAALLKLADTPAALAEAMKEGGDFAYLTQDSGPRRFAGVIEALMIQVPEKFGMELANIDEGFALDVRSQLRGFVESLKMRKPASVTVETVRIFERHVLAGPTSQGTAYETLLELSSHPGHALNADYLHAHLAAMKLSDRDAEWSAFLFHGFENDGPVSTLIDWASSVEASKADPERLRLAASTLSWFLSTSDRQVRDHATKALASLFYKSPDLIVGSLTRFLSVNDPYIRERVLAAAYGALLHLRDRPDVLRSTANEAYRIFSGVTVERHAVIRDYARAIIDLAMARGSLPQGVSLERCHPPYKSPRIAKWPDMEAIKRLDDNDGAIGIILSTTGYIGAKHDATMAGDFGRYAMVGIDNHFSAERRHDGKPQTPADAKHAFWNSVAALGADLAALGEAAQGAKETLDKAAKSAPRDLSDLQAAFWEAESKLKTRLPVALRRRYTKASPYLEHTDDWIPEFSLSVAQRWVAARAVALGWSKEKHEQIERNNVGSWNRYEHAIERIGKKYQWIAYWELIGYLAEAPLG